MKVHSLERVMSSTKQPKGKFINAFQSIQMISDYVEPEAPVQPPPKVFNPIELPPPVQQQTLLHLESAHRVHGPNSTKHLLTPQIFGVTYMDSILVVIEPQMSILV